ncbi:hypothetical protein F4679DRAFT_580335 [Xylaria curta]|nr:hypothetical protein F4679DRAFT_580335 [Xylaria curta]
MAGPQFYTTTPDGYVAPPPYWAATATERKPLLRRRDTESCRAVRKPNKRGITIAVVALHLIAGLYVLNFMRFIEKRAGPAGIAAAQYLRNSPTAQHVQFNITIFESKPVIGEPDHGRGYCWQRSRVGQYLFTRDSERVLKDKVDFFELSPQQIGYYKNDIRAASAVRPFKKTPLLIWLKLLWTYGSSVGRGDKLAQDGSLRNTMLNAPFIADVEEIFKSLGLLKPLKQRAPDMLSDCGISVQYSTDILEPQVQRAYGQSLNQVTGLTSMMAAAQESASAYGGGDLIERLQRIAKKIDVSVRTSTRVTGIKYLRVDEKQPAWLIRHESVDGSGGGGDDSSFQLFDKVIMAALDLDVQLENGDEPTPSLTTHYNINTTTVDATTARELDPFISVQVTFFTSDARLSPWSHDEDQVLFLEARKAAGMRELALVREIVSYHDFSTKVEYLYRVLSDRPVIEELQSRAEITWSYETKRYPPFELPWAPGFWWTSVIQRAGTSIDLNWFAGKVVAEELIKGAVT